MASLFSSPKLPAVKPPQRMPTPDDKEAEAEKMRKANELRMQKGRYSTDLSGEGKTALGK